MERSRGGRPPERPLLFALHVLPFLHPIDDMARRGSSIRAWSMITAFRNPEEAARTTGRCSSVNLVMLGHRQVEASAPFSIDSPF